MVSAASALALRSDKKSPQGEPAGFGHPSLSLLREGGEARLSDGTDVSRHGITIPLSILIKCNCRHGCPMTCWTAECSAAAAAGRPFAGSSGAWLWATRMSVGAIRQSQHPLLQKLRVFWAFRDMPLVRRQGQIAIATSIMRSSMIGSAPACGEFNIRTPHGVPLPVITWVRKKAHPWAKITLT